MTDIPNSEFLVPVFSTPQKDLLIWDAFISPYSHGEAPTSKKSSGKSSDLPTQEEA